MVRCHALFFFQSKSMLSKGEVIMSVMPYDKIPAYLKMAMTIKEAAEYSNIGINKIESMLRAPNCPFVLYVGTKKLVKRKEFEEFISKTVII